MPAELFALIAATGWAVNGVLVRHGSRTGNVLGAALMSFAVTAAFLWSYVVFSHSIHLVRSEATLYFILSGCLQPILARSLNYVGISRLGVSRSASLRNTDPLYAVLIAVVFLRERPGALIYLGTLLTVSGAWTVLSGRDGRGDFRLVDALFPLGAAVFAAVSHNLRRFGLLILPNPFVAAAITTTTSLAWLSSYLVVTGKIKACQPDEKSFPSFGAAALVSAGAQFLTFSALKEGAVSVVVPLLSTTPLFSIALSLLFIKNLEAITGRVVLGAVMIVLGVILITTR